MSFLPRIIPETPDETDCAEHSTAAPLHEPQQEDSDSELRRPTPPTTGEPPSSDPNIRKLLKSLRSLRGTAAGSKPVNAVSKHEAKLLELTAKLEWLKIIKTLSITRAYHAQLVRRHREDARREASAAHSAVNKIISCYKLSWKYTRRRRAANVLLGYLSTSKVDKKWLLVAARVRASAFKVQRVVRDWLVCRAHQRYLLYAAWYVAEKNCLGAKEKEKEKEKVAFERGGAGGGGEERDSSDDSGNDDDDDDNDINDSDNMAKKTKRMAAKAKKKKKKRLHKQRLHKQRKQKQGKNKKAADKEGATQVSFTSASAGNPPPPSGSVSASPAPLVLSWLRSSPHFGHYLLTSPPPHIPPGLISSPLCLVEAALSRVAGGVWSVGGGRGVFRECKHVKFNTAAHDAVRREATTRMGEMRANKNN